MKQDIINKVLALQDISLQQALYLYNNVPISELLNLGDKVRYIHNPLKKVSYQIDRNVNYTNICVSGCKFCTFHCKPSEKEKSYLLSLEDYRPKIEELIRLGGSQLLLQGGLNPRLKIDYFENLFKKLKEIEPSLKLNALGPPEVAYIAQISNISTKEALERLVSAGLDTFPGAGAEILDDIIRKELSPGKPSAKEWIKVMKEAHQLGLSTTATMVYGSIESIEQRLQHIFTIRDIQKEKPASNPGFRAFISWPMQFANNIHSNDIVEYLKIVAISRLILHNITHIQASWLTIGINAATMSLHCGADDLGSIMIEENVVSSTGHKKNTLNEEGMIKTISKAGFSPWLRNQEYSSI